MMSKHHHSIKYTNKAKKTYSGAGIVLVEERYTLGTKPTEPAVILYVNKCSKKLEDLGGSLSKSDLSALYPIAEGARREATEESATYINFSDTGAFGKSIGDTDVFVDHNEYRCYFVGIPSGYFSRSDALSCLKANRHKHHFNEMSDVQRVYISDLESYGIHFVSGDLLVPDANGNLVTIAGRTKAVIRNALQKRILSLVLKFPRTVHKIKDIKANTKHLLIR